MTFASYELTIDAPVEVVWEHLTTAEGLVRWVGPDAVADPVPGGALRWTHPDGSTVVGRFVELIHHRRVVFTYGWEGGRMGVPPESTTVEIDLSEEDGTTTLRLVHRGLPADAVEDHERGWAYFLGLLRDRLNNVQGEHRQADDHVRRLEEGEEGGRRPRREPPPDRSRHDPGAEPADWQAPGPAQPQARAALSQAPRNRGGSVRPG